MTAMRFSAWLITVLRGSFPFNQREDMPDASYLLSEKEARQGVTYGDCRSKSAR